MLITSMCVVVKNGLLHAGGGAGHRGEEVEEEEEDGVLDGPWWARFPVGLLPSLCQRGQSNAQADGAK